MRGQDRPYGPDSASPASGGPGNGSGDFSGPPADLGSHGEPVQHRCELCTESLGRDEVLRHLRLFHPDRWDEINPSQEEAA